MNRERTEEYIRDLQIKQAAREVARHKPVGFGDYLVDTERQAHEGGLTVVVGLIVAIFTVGVVAMTFYGTIHPIQARILAALTHGGF